MFCEAYRETLKDAAADGSAIRDEVRSHLAACGACAAAFSEEQALFAAMDSNLSKLVNAHAPPSLLPRVREAIYRGRVSSRRAFLNWVWLPAAAAAAVALAVFLPRVFHSAQPQNVSVSVVQPTPPAIRAAKTAKNSSSVPSDHSRNGNGNRRATLPIVAGRSVSEPEIIVPQQEEVALASYAAMLRKHADLAQGLLDSGVKKSATIEPLVIAEIDSSELKIEPLVRDSDDVTK